MSLILEQLVFEILLMAKFILRITYQIVLLVLSSGNLEPHSQYLSVWNKCAIRLAITQIKSTVAK